MLVRARNGMANHETGICSCLCTFSLPGQGERFSNVARIVCGLRMDPGFCLTVQALTWTQANHTSPRPPRPTLLWLRKYSPFPSGMESSRQTTVLSLTLQEGPPAHPNSQALSPSFLSHVLWVRRAASSLAPASL